MTWIRSRNYYNVPKELYYDGWQTDRNKDGDTPLMLWIHTYPSENIPQELFYTGYKTDKNNRGQTPLMIWIDYSKDDVDDVPECLLYPGC